MRRDVRAGQAVKRWTFGVSFVMSGYPHIGREAHLTDVPASALDPVVDYVGLFDQGVRAGVSTLTPSVFPAARLQSASPIPPGGDRIGFTYEITTGPPRLP